MLSLTKFLALLPGIKPLKARKMIIEGDLLTAEQRRDMHDRSRSILDLVVEVGPDAAAAIYAAYRANLLPMQTARTLPQESPGAEAYLAEAPRHREVLAKRRRRDELVRDPKLLEEKDLNDYSLLNQIFFQHVGPGRGTLQLAGLEVTKTLHGYQSNSGKTTGWHVTFSWRGSDGKQRHLEDIPPEAYNRRNDAERDWGLPE